VLVEGRYVSRHAPSPLRRRVGPLICCRAATSANCTSSTRCSLYAPVGRGKAIVGVGSTKDE